MIDREAVAFLACFGRELKSLVYSMHTISKYGHHKKNVLKDFQNCLEFSFISEFISI